MYCTVPIVLYNIIYRTVIKAAMVAFATVERPTWWCTVPGLPAVLYTIVLVLYGVWDEAELYCTLGTVPLGTVQ